MNDETAASVGIRDRMTVDLALLVLRVVVGFIFAAHGAQKVLGVFGGPGLNKMAEMMGPIAYPVSLGEFLGGIGLIFGFLTRFSALSLIVIMAGAIGMVHGQHGFFMAKGPETMMKESGFEYNVALIGMLLPILLAGPGSITLGRLFLPKSKRTGRPVVVLE